MNIFRRKPKKKLYFVVRNGYQIPLGHRVVEFEADNIIEWVQKHWVTDEVDEMHSDNLVGRVYNFDSIWDAMLEYGNKSPRNTTELKEWAELISVEGEVIVEDGYLSTITDDDEICVEWCFFTEEFKLQHPERVDYALHPTWEFPLTFEEQGQEVNLHSIIPLKKLSDAEEGTTYCVFLTARDGSTIQDVTGSFKFEGIRLPEFGNYLRETENPMKQGWDGNMRPFWEAEIILLKAHLILQGVKSIPELFTQMGEEVNKLNANCSPLGNKLYADPFFMVGDREKLIQDTQELQSLCDSQGERSVWKHKTASPRVQTSEHFCQIRFHEIVYDPDQNHDQTEHLSSVFYFDDLWIAANPVLAESLIRYSKGPHFVDGVDIKRERSIDLPYVEPTAEEEKQNEFDSQLRRKIDEIKEQWSAQEENNKDASDPFSFLEINFHGDSLTKYAIELGLKTEGLKLDPETGLPESFYELVAANIADKGQ